MANQSSALQRLFTSFQKYIEDKKIASLIFISLLGGIPGLINVYDWLTEIPDFSYHLISFSNGETTPPSPKAKFYLLSGAMYNPGELPLFPVHFVLEIEFEDGTKKSIEAIGINDTLLKKLNTPVGEGIPISTGATNDLMQTVRLKEKDAQYGILFFPLPHTSQDLSNPKQFTLTCINIDHEGFASKIDLSKFASGRNRYIPKVDIQFK